MSPESKSNHARLGPSAGSTDTPDRGLSSPQQAPKGGGPGYQPDAPDIRGLLRTGKSAVRPDGLCHCPGVPSRAKGSSSPLPSSPGEGEAAAGALPFVYLNLAMTADGKIATVNRAGASFSSRRDREHMMELRASADAVMSGARTVDLNPVNLGPGGKKYRRLRLRHGLKEYNLRVVVSGSGTLNPEAEIFKQRFSPIIVLSSKAAGQRRLARLRAVADDVIVCGEKEVDFRQALNWLHRKWGVRRLLCEGGGELDDALFRAGVVNELHLTICPKIFGGRQGPTIADGVGMESLAAAARLQLKSQRRMGDEMFLVYAVRK